MGAKQTPQALGSWETQVSERPDCSPSALGLSCFPLNPRLSGHLVVELDPLAWADRCRAAGGAGPGAVSAQRAALGSSDSTRPCRAPAPCTPPPPG